MTEKELLQILNNLKSVNPDQAWLKSNREILLAQVSNSGTENLSVWTKFLIDLKSLARTASRPAFAFGSFLVVLVSAALFGHQAFTQIKPNDSFYIARVISERARLNTVFNEADRDQLAMQFATERAKDITSVLSDPSFNTEENQSEVDKLNQNFNKEITTVKNAISRAKLIPAVTTDAPANNDNSLVTSADSSKDNQGVQVYSQPNPNDKASDTLAPAKNTPVKSRGTSTQAIASSTPAQEKIQQDKGTIIDEAKKMFDDKNYNQALDKLNEIDELIKK